MKKLDGLLPAIVIPYKENFIVDEEVLRKYVEWISKFNIKGIVINSDAGEGHFLSHEERKKNIRIIKEIVK
ncbi:MAG: dihydrodipicolinate synthase family protein, partial [Candidatus Omnitrophica bacterium]|nr:dihydrodipicolinate synthase family protein [Candidatus Omnitrophota bacterium]